METVSDECPTGILVDIDFQSKVLSNRIKDNKETQASTKKEKVIAAGTKSSHSWTSNCLLDQCPPRPSPILQMKFFTPKSNLRTPSPKSMKIISREASRIVNQLYSSPINCSEVMIYDEVFPAVKTLDDACLDEFPIKSKNLPTIDDHIEKVDQSNPDSLDFTKCSISAVNSCKSKEFLSNEKLSKIVLQSDIRPPTEQDSISNNTVETTTPENTSNQKSFFEFYVKDKDEKNVICAENSNSVIPECINVSNDKLLAHEHEVNIHKKIPEVAKGLDFKMSLAPSERNKENIPLYNGGRQTKCGSRLSKAEESSSRIKDGPTETKIKKNQILKNESKVEKSSKNITAKCLVLEKKIKENQNLEDSFLKNPKPFLQKSNVKRSQSLIYKKDPLCKTAPLLETPVVSSVRQVGSSRNAFPVEKRFMPVMSSCSRVLKPKMSLNQVSDTGNGLSTPLQFGRFKPASSSTANPMRRKSLAFNSNYSLVASGIKVAPQNDQHSNIKKPSVVSSRLGHVKKLSMPSSNLKLKNDNLSRKLFP